MPRLSTSGRGGGDSPRGTAALEFALVLPLLMTLVLGCVDFGRFAFSYLAVTNAARSGAAFGSVHPYTPATLAAWQAGVRQAARDEMSALGGFDDRLLAVVVSPQVQEDGSRWTQVEVSYPFETVVGWPGIPAQVSLRQAVSMPAIREE